MPTLLVADDSVTIQRVIELTFASEDVRVVMAADGAAAIQRIETEPPDIVLADVGMPRVDGYAVAAHVKQSATLREIPVLLLTGAFEPIDQDRARASGCDGVLVKPFEPQELVGRVRQLLNSQRAPRLGLVSVSRPASAGMGPLKDARDVRPHEGLEEETFRRELDQLDEAFARLDPESPPTNTDGETDPEIARDLELYRTSAVGSSRALGGWDLPTPPPQATASPASTGTAAVAYPSIWNHHEGHGGPGEEADQAAESLKSSAEAPAAPPAEASSTGRPVTRSGVTMADAFSALLAAEKDNSSPPPPSRVAISEAMMEEIVRRAVSRMSEEAVRRIVTETAERLVREEIEKFKRHAE